MFRVVDTVQCICQVFSDQLVIYNRLSFQVICHEHIARVHSQTLISGATGSPTGDDASRCDSIVITTILVKLQSTFQYFPSFCSYFPIPRYSRPLATPSEWNLDKNGEIILGAIAPSEAFSYYLSKFHAFGIAGGRPDAILSISFVTDATNIWKHDQQLHVTNQISERGGRILWDWDKISELAGCTRSGRILDNCVNTNRASYDNSEICRETIQCTVLCKVHGCNPNRLQSSRRSKVSTEFTNFDPWRWVTQNWPAYPTAKSQSFRPVYKFILLV